MASPTLLVYLETTPGNYVQVGTQTINVDVNQPFDRNNDSFLAGTASFTFTDATGAFNPANASSTYGQYMVPMQKVMIKATYNSNTYFIFDGWSQAFSYRPAKDGNVATMTINAIDGLGILAQTNISNVFYYQTAGQTTGYRIYGILLTAQYYGAPSMPSIIMVGGTTVQADPGTNRTALQAMQTVDNSENGALFYSATGFLYWLSRQEIYKSSSATPYIFNDDGTGIKYLDVTFAYDTDFISNYVTVAPPTLAAQSIYSTTSIADYFQRNLYRGDVIMDTTDDALNQAKSLLIGRKDPILRITNFSLNADGSDDTQTTAALAINYYSPVKVTRHDPSGAVITKNLYCVGFTWKITPTTWKVTIQTAEPDLYGFVLDKTYPLAGGILGTNQLTY